MLYLIPNSEILVISVGNDVDRVVRVPSEGSLFAGVGAIVHVVGSLGRRVIGRAAIFFEFRIAFRDKI